MNLSENFKKFVEGVGATTRKGVENVAAVASATEAALQLKNDPQWEFHAYVDQTKSKPHMNEWAGGYNRKSRNAGSFYGGYDAAMRWPEKTAELKTLAKGYQMMDALTSFIAGKGEQGSFKNEMEDALANLSGIEAAERDFKAGKKFKLETDFNEDIAVKAKQWAETYTNKE